LTKTDRLRAPARFIFTPAILAAVAAITAAPSFAQDDKQAPRPIHYDRTVLDNAYVTVSRDTTPCAKAEPGRCEDRVIVAMSKLEITSGNRKIRLKRGEVAVFKAGDSYEVPADATYFEVAIKPGHPPVKSPPEIIPPPKNLIMYQGDKFFIYNERLAVGDTRPRHSHSQRVEIRLSNGPMLHQWLWEGDQVKEIEPSRVNWREPMIHEVRNVGDAPLSNLIVEFMPEKK
jgi:hypothetical protein